MPILDVERQYVDQILTNYIKYANDTTGADFIAPPFTTDTVSGKYEFFGNINSRVYDDRLGRKEESKEIGTRSELKSYLTEEYGSHAWISPRDKKFRVQKRRALLERQKVDTIRETHSLNRLSRVLELATGALVPTGAASTPWSNKTTATPFSDILKGFIALSIAR